MVWRAYTRMVRDSVILTVILSSERRVTVLDNRSGDVTFCWDWLGWRWSVVVVNPVGVPLVHLVTVDPETARVSATFADAVNSGADDGLAVG